jgi:Family of unknown function (DUF6136)
MPATYLDLRLSHYRLTLKAWFRGLDKALIASASALTFILTALLAALLFGLAQGLQLLVEPQTSLTLRAAVVAAWQAASLLLLRSLHEATFMPRPRAFFETLPIRGAHKLRADVLLSAASYSILWLPVAWLIANPLQLGREPSVATLAELVELAALSLCVNITLLRGTRRHALAALAATASFALLRGAGAAPSLGRLGCALLAGAALWSSYLPGAARAARAARRARIGEPLVLGSGLVVGLLTHGLRTNLLVRLGAIAATLGACLGVIRLRTNDTSSASVVVFVAAAAALALYSLPALCRNTLLTRLAFLAGQPAFSQRMRLAAYGIPTMFFVAALAGAWGFDRSGTAGRDALVFSLLYLSGVIGARLGWKPTTWLVPFTSMISLIILAAMT